MMIWKVDFVAIVIAFYQSINLSRQYIDKHLEYKS